MLKVLRSGPLITMLGRFKYMDPAAFFVKAGLVLALLLNIVTPPLQAPDEFSHFYRAYQVSEGRFLPVKQEQRLGGPLPAGIVRFSDHYRNAAYIMNYTLSYREIGRTFRIGLLAQEPQFQDFANTAYYSPVSYLPQAFALLVLRQFNSSPAVMYYGGRLFTLFIWIVCMFYVIRTLPVFKWLFCFLALLPMQPYLANSFSADTVTNLLSLLFIALTLKHIFVSRAISYKQLAALALLLALLALAKVVYIGLVLLLFAIPGHKFGSRARRFLSLGLLFLLSAFLAGCWSNAVMALYIPFKDYNPAFREVACLSPCGDYYAQQAYILSHGAYFLKVIWHSLVDHPGFSLRGYIGVLGNGDIGLPPWLYVPAYLLIVLLALAEKNTFRFNGKQKLLLFASAAAAFLLLILSQHLIWDCVGEGVVDMLQGRYLIPIFPLLFMLLPNGLLFDGFTPAAAVLPGVIVLNLFSGLEVYKRFFAGLPAQRTEYYCDAERLDGAGGFSTTTPGVAFGNAGSQSTAAHRSGSHAALLTPEAPFCFTYKFDHLRKGDLVEVEAWQKGEGGILVVTGKQPGCGEFYFGGTSKGHYDKDGWLLLRNVCPITMDCDSAQLAFYTWNPGKTAFYLDDVKLKITRFIPAED